jgi:membrane-associated phospholipid phosphatase
MSRNAKRKLLIIMGVLALFSLALSLYARWTVFFPGDLYLTLLLQSFGNAALTRIMLGVSWIFGGWQAILLVFPAGLLMGRWLGWLECILVWGSGLFSLLDQAFKIAVSRPRPTAEQVRVIGINYYDGFPSGHAFFAVLFLGILAYILFTHLKKRSLRILSLIIFITLGLLVGISRVYLGAHWPSDVFGGYVVGSLVLAILVLIYEKWQARLASGN